MAQLKAAGVASIKIEGRLRTPEYAAAAVTACRAARAGQPYNEALLRDIFSRSGFSDAYLVGRNDGTMFGVRTEADAAATRRHAESPRAVPPRTGAHSGAFLRQRRCGGRRHQADSFRRQRQPCQCVQRR